MKLHWLTVAVLVWGVTNVRAVDLSTMSVQESSITVEPQETDQTTSSQESEAKGIIPDNVDVLTSTQPITPVSNLPEKAPYVQATDELIKALDLWNTGHAEAASDTALEAYDDLIELHRVPGVKRTKMRAQIHQAASVYVEAGIAYIKNFVKQSGNTPDALDEGRDRLEDLRDVARNYPELNRMLQNAIDHLASPTPQKAQ
jgi:hypothetical protein